MATHIDEPKSLGKEAVRAARFSLLQNDIIYSLTSFVEEIRHESNLTDKVPYFDPLDGGIDSKILFILEAPGAKAVESGFVSRNNPDETAKNIFNRLSEAGIERSESVLWNIVPWYIGTGKKIRAANKTDIAEGMIYLDRLLKLLPALNAIVLVGKKAAQAKSFIAKITTLKIFETYHPSPLFANNKPENKEVLARSFSQIKEYITSKTND